MDFLKKENLRVFTSQRRRSGSLISALRLSLSFPILSLKHLPIHPSQQNADGFSSMINRLSSISDRDETALVPVL